MNSSLSIDYNMYLQLGTTSIIKIWSRQAVSTFRTFGFECFHKIIRILVVLDCIYCFSVFARNPKRGAIFQRVLIKCAGGNFGTGRGRTDGRTGRTGRRCGSVRQRLEWRRDGIGGIPPPCHTFLTFWSVGSRGGVLCAIVAREGTSGRRPAVARFV